MSKTPRKPAAAGRHPARLLRHGLLPLPLLLLPVVCPAEWAVSRHEESGIRIAHIVNAAGHRLEIYKDNVAAIRSRFSLGPGLDRLAARSCPTYQIDARRPDNRSVNEAPCLNRTIWGEYILGYVGADKRVVSAHLHDLVNGGTITFRYRLENGGYDQTRFSLAGSKRAIEEALGQDLTISP